MPSSHGLVLTISYRNPICGPSFWSDSSIVPTKSDTSFSCSPSSPIADVILSSSGVCWILSQITDESQPLMCHHMKQARSWKVLLGHLSNTLYNHLQEHPFVLFHSSLHQTLIDFLLAREVSCCDCSETGHHSWNPVPGGIRIKYTIQLFLAMNEQQRMLAWKRPPPLSWK